MKRSDELKARGMGWRREARRVLGGLHGSDRVEEGGGERGGGGRGQGRRADQRCASEITECFVAFEARLVETPSPSQKQCKCAHTRDCIAWRRSHTYHQRPCGNRDATYSHKLHEKLPVSSRSRCRCKLERAAQASLPAPAAAPSRQARCDLPSGLS
eukprot:6193066-Pleurochrysis_carterae.AAC.1